MEMLKIILDSKVGQALGVSLVFIAFSWILWNQLNYQVDGRLESQDARITALERDNEFFRGYMAEEQEQRKTLFTAIEGHLKAVTKHLENYYDRQ